MRVYVAGPYTPHDGRAETRQRNIERAAEAARQLVLAGHAPFCPHTMTTGWGDDLPYAEIIRLCISWVTACDALVLLPGWQESRGAQIELLVAEQCGIPVVQMDDLGKWLGTLAGLASGQLVTIRTGGQ